MQDLLHEFPNVPFMVVNAEILLNQASHAFGSPQLIVPAINFRDLPKQVFQLMKLRFIQARLGSELRKRCQATGTVTIQVEPEVKRPPRHAQNVNNRSMGLVAPSIQQRVCAAVRVLLPCQGVSCLYYRKELLDTLPVRGAIIIERAEKESEFRSFKTPSG
jgi:hypothetical protein